MFLEIKKQEIESTREVYRNKSLDQFHTDGYIEAATLTSEQYFLYCKKLSEEEEVIMITMLLHCVACHCTFPLLLQGNRGESDIFKRGKYSTTS